MKFEELFKPKPGSLAAEMQKTIDGLNQEIKELRAHAERVGEANDRLAVENDDLRKDKARLDWFLKLEEDDRVKFCRGWYRWTPEKAKAEIDAELRKEAQP